MAETTNVLVGRKLGSLRSENGFRQADVALLMRERAGIHWTRATVANVEAGLRDVSLDELVGLCLVFAIDLASFFSDAVDRWVQIGQEGVVSTTLIRAALGDAAAASEVAASDQREHELTPATRQPGDITEAVALGVVRWYREVLGVYVGTIDPDAAALIYKGGFGVGEAEGKAAVRLGVPPIVVQRLSHLLWARSFTDERDRRAGHSPDDSPRSVQAKRGHAARQMLNELRAFLTDECGGMDAVGARLTAFEDAGREQVKRAIESLDDGSGLWDTAELAELKASLMEGE